MKITIGVLGSMDPDDIIDVSNYLTNDRDIPLSQEAERDMFERTVDDVTLYISNLKNRFTDFFLGRSPSTWWEVVVMDAPLVWIGRIEPTIKFMVKEKKIEFTAFSLDRVFWDLCKASTIKQSVSGFHDVKGNYDPFTVRGALEVFLEGYGRPCRDLGLNVYVDPLYTDRPVNQDIEYALDDTMTIEELLMGYAHYYNAQFHIDAETRTLMMLQRSMPIHHDDTDLDAVLLDDVPIEYDDTDLRKFDYAEININIPTPPAASFDVYTTGGVSGFTNIYVSYVTTFVISDGGFEYESAVSPQSNRKLLLNLNHTGNDGAKITVAQGPAGTTKRKIYREFGGGYSTAGVFRYVGEIPNNIDTVFLDEMSNEELSKQPPANIWNIPTGLMWSRYDEEKGVWIPPIVEYQGRQSKTAGSIYQIQIAWRFIRVSDNSSVSGNELPLALRYFGNEINFDAFSKQWRELFISRGRLKCSAKGTGYRYGQTFVCTQLPNVGRIDKRLFAVKLENIITRKRTSMELVTI
jgi:hypothetical protein